MKRVLFYCCNNSNICLLFTNYCIENCEQVTHEVCCFEVVTQIVRNASLVALVAADSMYIKSQRIESSVCLNLSQAIVAGWWWLRVASVALIDSNRSGVAVIVRTSIHTAFVGQ